MEDHQAFVLVGIIRSVQSDTVIEKSFTVSDIVESVWNHFEVEFSPETIQAVMQSAVEAAGSSNLIDHITSKYASDRFVMMVSEPREIAKYSDVLEVWDKAMRAGDGWLREALRNIRSVEGGDAKTRSDVEVGAHETKSVPASDRYVSTTDNQSVVDEIYAQLELASSEINGSNSIGEEERQIALSEIAIFEAAICQPRLAQDLIERFLRFCLEKLSGWIGGAAVGLLIDKLKTLIDAFISSTLP